MSSLAKNYKRRKIIFARRNFIFRFVDLWNLILVDKLKQNIKDIKELRDKRMSKISNNKQSPRNSSYDRGSLLKGLSRPKDPEKLAFADLPKGLAAWDAVPMAGKVQILLAAGLIELASELKKPVRHPCS